MATISEIAKAAGVGVTTVSRYLNHHPYISAEKRTRI
ncbi:MAG: LacI family DNA-binding transcriptional regulator, partial [Lacticaseibacillus paracasei]|nr:LacI family DNA-binding transcriptional regulator [Lacticaseibacillus paracasei]